MNLDVLHNALHTAFSFGNAVISLIAHLRAGEAGSAAGDLLTAIPFLVPFIVALVFVIAIRKKWKSLLIALAAVILYGGMEYISEKGIASAVSSVYVLIGGTALILGLSMLLFLFIYAMFHRRSRRRETEIYDEESAPADYEEDVVPAEEEQSYYEDPEQ